VAFILVLCVAIWRTTNEAWLTVWFLLLFFVGIPLLLIAIRDALISVKPAWLGRGPLLLHTCAVFAALVGYFVGWMAVDSEHPKAHLHQAFVVIFPLMVYATPLLMIFHGMPISRLKYFYFGGDEEDSDDR
jgi:hypothetical protein